MEKDQQTKLCDKLSHDVQKIATETGQNVLLIREENGKLVLEGSDALKRGIAMALLSSPDTNKIFAEVQAQMSQSMADGSTQPTPQDNEFQPDDNSTISAPDPFTISPLPELTPSAGPGKKHNKRLSCKFCGKGFNRASLLRRHMQAHEETELNQSSSHVGDTGENVFFGIINNFNPSGQANQGLDLGNDINLSTTDVGEVVVEDVYIQTTESSGEITAKLTIGGSPSIQEQVDDDDINDDDTGDNTLVEDVSSNLTPQMGNTGSPAVKAPRKRVPKQSTPRKPFECKECDAKFRSSIALKNHHHTESLSDQPGFNKSCKMCDKRFNSVKLLMLHIVEHEDYIVTKEDILEMEIEEMNKCFDYGADPKNKYSCWICKWRFDGHHKLRTHMCLHTTNFQKKIKLLNANVDMSEFTDPDTDHNAIEDKPVITYPKEGVVPETITSGEDQLGSVSDNDLDETESFTGGEVEELESSAGGEVEKFVVLTTDGKARRYACKRCGKDFSNAVNLLKHVVTHDDITVTVDELIDQEREQNKGWPTYSSNPAYKLFCKICDWRFSKPSVLKRHMNKHRESIERKSKLFTRHKTFIEGNAECFERRDHHPTGELNEFHKLMRDKSLQRPGNDYACSFCGWRFSIAGYLKEHMVAMHADSLTKEDFLNIELQVMKSNSFYCSDPSFKHDCKICGWRFEFKYRLNMHMGRHTNLITTLKRLNLGGDGINLKKMGGSNTSRAGLDGCTLVMDGETLQWIGPSQRLKGLKGSTALLVGTVVIKDDGSFQAVSSHSPSDATGGDSLKNNVPSAVVRLVRCDEGKKLDSKVLLEKSSNDDDDSEDAEDDDEVDDDDAEDGDVGENSDLYNGRSNKKSNNLKGKKFVCRVCGTNFEDANSLLAHMVKSHKEVYLSAEDTLALERHQSMGHASYSKKSEGKYVCKICDWGFNKQLKLKRHMATHRTNINDKARLFKKSLASSPLGKQESYQDSAETYQEKTGGMSSADLSMLQQTCCEKSKEKPENSYECHICSWRFPNTTFLKQHMSEVHHASIEDLRKIDILSMKSSKWYCSDPMKEYVCNICDWRFGNSTRRKEHMRRHTNSSDGLNVEAFSTVPIGRNVVIINDDGRYQVVPCQPSEVGPGSSGSKKSSDIRKRKVQSSSNGHSKKVCHDADGSAAESAKAVSMKIINNLVDRQDDDGIDDDGGFGDSNDCGAKEGMGDKDASEDDVIGEQRGRSGIVAAGIQKDGSLNVTGISEPSLQQQEVKFTVAQMKESKWYCNATSYTLSCNLCGWRFKRKVDKMRHLKKHVEYNEDEDQSTKRDGNEKFTAEQMKQLRSYTTNPSYPYVCSLCDWRFQGIRHLNIHKAKHVEVSTKSKLEEEIEQCKISLQYCDDPNRKMECYLCGWRFNDMRCYKKHLLRLHDIKKNNKEMKMLFGKTSVEGSCPTEIMGKNEKASSEKSTTSEILEETNMTGVQQVDEPGLENEDKSSDVDVHKADNTRNRCKDCDELFSSPEELIQHSNEKHEKKHECSRCGLRFKFLGYLKSHEEQNCGMSYKCDFCHEIFVTFMEHKAHCEFAHEEEIKCQFCDERVITIVGMRKHLNSNHMELASFLCIKCDAKYFTEKDLKFHHTVKHAKPVACWICDEVFETPNLLSKHFTIHKGYNPYKCDYCEKSFRLIGKLNEHVKLKHGMPFKCSVCPRRFTTKEESKTHEDKSHQQSNLSLMCEICGVICASSRRMAKHKLKHREVLKRYQCDVCSKWFSSPAFVRQHARVHTGERPFTCEVCGKGFKEKCALKRHAKTHADLQFECPICKKTYKTKRSLEDHITGHTSRPFKCPDCPKSYPTAQSLNIHQKYHLPSAPKGRHFPCPYCTEVFTSKIKRRDHVHFHQDTPIYSCSICGKVYKIESDAQEHMERHETCKTEYKCQMCKQQFPSRQALNVHKAQHLARGEYVVRCDLCGKKFFDQAHYKKHMIMHSDIKSHGCKLCKKSYKSKASLVTHIRNEHTKDKPFSCQYCDKSFASVSRRTHHMVIHTKEKRHPCRFCGEGFMFYSQRIRHEAKCMK